jgi:hypothetical protein
MNDPNEKKYKQLALFSVIVAEVVVTPSVLGGLVFWLMQGMKLQMALTALAAFIGLAVAIYRIYQVYRIQNKDSKS